MQGFISFIFRYLLRYLHVQEYIKPFIPSHHLLTQLLIDVIAQYLNILLLPLLVTLSFLRLPLLACLSLGFQGRATLVAEGFGLKYEHLVIAEVLDLTAFVLEAGFRVEHLGVSHFSE